MLTLYCSMLNLARLKFKYKQCYPSCRDNLKAFKIHMIKKRVRLTIIWYIRRFKMPTDIVCVHGEATWLY